MLDLSDTKFNRFENRSILEDLIDLINKNCIIPFVGAGMSSDIYKSWAVVLKDMMEGNFHGREDEAKDIEKLIDGGDYETAAQEIHDVLGDITLSGSIGCAV